MTLKLASLVFPLSIYSQIHSDSTIRIFGHNDFCLHKRFNGYARLHDVFVWPCEPDISSPNKIKTGRYRWEYDRSTGLVKSVGSFEANSEKPYCWMTQNPERVSQRLRIAACDENDITQQFDYGPDGRFFSRANKGLCAHHSRVNYTIFLDNRH